MKAAKVKIRRRPGRRRTVPKKSTVALRLRPSVRHLAPYIAPEEGREGKLRLDFNENTVGCSPAVLRALRGITREQLTLYPEYELSVRRLAKSFGVRPAEMLLTNGVDDALRLLMETFIDPGNTVLIPEPTFSMYRFFSEVAGARVETVRYDEAMRFPLQATLKALRRAPRVLFLANPNNPTGTLLDRAALTRILDAAPRTLVVVDEAYFEFSGLTVLPWIRKRHNLVVSRTFSKAAGLAALRLGALFAQAKLADAMRRAFTPYPVNSAALVAAEAAIGDQKLSAPLRAPGAGKPTAVGTRPGAAGSAGFPQRGEFFAGGFWVGRGPTGAATGGGEASCCVTAPAILVATVLCA